MIGLDPPVLLCRSEQGEGETHNRIFPGYVYAHVDSLTSITSLVNDRDTTNINAEERGKKERRERGKGQRVAVLPSASTPAKPCHAVAHHVDNGTTQ